MEQATPNAAHPVAPRWPRLRRELLIILFLAAFALAVTWPVVTKMATEIVGGTGDSHLFYWNYWWFNHALFELKQSPFFCPLQLYPYGADLAFHTLCPFNCLLALPFQKLFGIPFAYNLVILFSLIAAAYTAHRLTHYLTGDRVASVAAGIMFGFSPYMLMRATGHINLIGAWPLPLVVMFTLRAFKTSKYRWAAFAGLFAGLQLWISMYYALFAAILFIFLWINATLFERRTLRNLLWCPCMAAASALVAASPILFVMTRSILKSGAFFAPPSRMSFTCGVDLLGFVLPNQFNTLFGKLTNPVYARLYGRQMEGLAFAGIACLVFAAIAIHGERNHTTRLLGVLAIVFGVLALGDKLHVADHDSYALFGRAVAIPLPAALLKPVPVLNMLRVASRFVLLFQLALACLAALGVARLLKRSEGSRRKMLIVFLPACLLLDLSCVPYCSLPPPRERLHRILGTIPGEFSIMDIPFGVGDSVRYYGPFAEDNRLWLAAQVVHRKPVIGTFASRVDPTILEELRASPLIEGIVQAQGARMTQETLDRLTPEVVGAELQRYKLKVIIAHRWSLNPCNTGQLAYLFKHIGFKLLYTDEQLAVIETPLGPSLEEFVAKPGEATRE